MYLCYGKFCTEKHTTNLLAYTRKSGKKGGVTGGKLGMRGGGGGGGNFQHGLACPAGAMRVNSIDWLGGAEPQKQIVSARYGVC